MTQLNQVMSRATQPISRWVDRVTEKAKQLVRHDRDESDERRQTVPPSGGVPGSRRTPFNDLRPAVAGSLQSRAPVEVAVTEVRDDQNWRPPEEMREGEVQDLPEQLTLSVDGSLQEEELPPAVRAARDSIGAGMARQALVGATGGSPDDRERLLRQPLVGATGGSPDDP